MSKELKPKYDFKEVEEGKYDFWLKGGFFEAGDKEKEPFTIVIPPPNVTGKLHLGHSWDTTLQDIIIRRKRMQGYDALWLPGMDHAGIATQYNFYILFSQKRTFLYLSGIIISVCGLRA